MYSKKKVDAVLTVHWHTCFSWWRLDLNVFYGLLEFVRLLVLSCLCVKSACYVREDSNFELSVGLTHTYSYLVMGLNLLKKMLWSLNVLNAFTLFQNTFYSAGKNYLLRMCNGEWYFFGEGGAVLKNFLSQQMKVSLIIWFKFRCVQ